LFLIVPPVLVAAEHFDEAICDLADDNGIEIWVCGEYCLNRPRREASQALEAGGFRLVVLDVCHSNVVDIESGRGDAGLVRVFACVGSGHGGIGVTDEEGDRAIFRAKGTTGGTRMGFKE